MKLMHLFGFVVISSGLAACSSYSNLNAQTSLKTEKAAWLSASPSRWKASKQNAEVSLALSDLSWGFELSPQLKSLLAQVVDANLELQLSTLQRQQTLLDLEIASGERLPKSDVTVTHRKMQVNTNHQTTWRDQYSGSVNVSWEFDVWQRLADGVKRKGALYQAQGFEHAAMLQSVQAKVLHAWLNVTEQSQLLTLNQRNIENQNRRLNMSMIRLDNGLASSIDVRNSRTNLLRLKAAQRQLIFKRDQAIRQLERLLGRYPSAELNASLSLPKLIQASEHLTPQDILLNRPDILAAEQRLLAAGFAWKESEKKHLPKLTLGLNYSTRQDTLSNIFDVDSWLASITSSIVQPIFYRGIRKKQAEQAQLQQQARWVQYKNLLLNAWQEVESAIQNEQLLEVRQNYLQRALTQAKAAERQVETQYSSGLATSFELLSAQRTRTSVESDLVRIDVSRLKNRIQLQLALGLPQMPTASQGAQE